MLEIPKRLSLTSQTAAAIRDGMEKNLWKDYLPGERRLSELLQVSRPTIRAALHLLAKDGLLDIRQGKRNRLPTDRVLRRGEGRKRLIGLVTHEPFSQISHATYQGVSEMRAHLAESGFATEVFICPSRGARAQERKLEAFLRHRRVFCCLLISVSRELQHWFSEHSVPALVLGSCHPSVRLPSLDVDHRSVCRHAANIFFAKGHRRVALVVPDSGLPGDLASERGFLEAAEQLRGADARPAVVRHSGTARTITAKLEPLFESGDPPTALLVVKPLHVLIVMSYLLRRGTAVPGSVSLIARDWDIVFEALSPPISHYTFDGNSYIRRLSRLMLQMANQSYLPAQQNLIFPKFFAGGTVRELA